METEQNKKVFDRPPYRRGSGIRCTICHEDDEQADYFIRWNQAAGNELLKDQKGWIYTLVCQYDMVYSS